MFLFNILSFDSSSFSFLLSEFFKNFPFSDFEINLIFAQQKKTARSLQKTGVLAEQSEKYMPKKS